MKDLFENMDTILLAYVVAQLVNVIASTLKYILTVKASAFVAAVANAISYTVSAIVVKLTVVQDMWVVIIITLTANIVGVPIGKWLINIFSKEKLWVYNATVKCTHDDAVKMREDIKENCGARSIYDEIVPDEMYSFRVFAYHRDQSDIIVKILKEHKAKFYIVQPM